MTPLRIGVPAELQGANERSGMGKMWRHVLAGLRATEVVTFADPAAPRRRFGRGRPAVDVWLSDCGLGPLPVDEPVVVQVHEAGWDDPEVRATLDDRFVELVLDGRVAAAARSATCVITPSASAQRQVVEHLGVPVDRVHPVPHGVDARRFRPGLPGAERLVAAAGGRADVPYVVFVSQIHPRKGLATLRAAMAQVAAAGHPHQLVVVGSPAQDRADSTDLDADVLGPDGTSSLVHLRDLDEDDVAAVLSGAAVFCLPSVMEGFGLTALEAMSCGVPVVVSDRGSLPEVVGDAGVVVPPTVDAVAEALVDVLGDRTLASALGLAGRQRAAAYSWEATTAGWLKVLREAAPARAG